MKKVIEKTKTKFQKYSYLGNYFVFLFKMGLFFFTKSLTFMISSLYNLGIGLTRKKIYSNKDKFLSVGIFLMMASMFFVFYSIWIVVSHKIVYYNLYTGLAIATVTFYDIVFSIYGIQKSIRNHHKKNNVLMLVNLATALISLELTQSALLSFTQNGVDHSLYNGIIGMIVGISAFLIGLWICLKDKKEQNIEIVSK